MSSGSGSTEAEAKTEIETNSQSKSHSISQSQSQFPSEYSCAHYTSAVYGLLTHISVVGVLEHNYDFYDVWKKKSTLFDEELVKHLKQYGHSNKSDHTKVDKSIEIVKKYMEKHAFCEFLLWEVGNLIENSDLQCKV